MNFVENATRNKIQAVAKSGNIFVNGEPVKSSYKVKANFPALRPQRDLGADLKTPNLLIRR